jgi:type II secretory pathway component PulJ
MRRGRVPQREAGDRRPARRAVRPANRAGASPARDAGVTLVEVLIACVVMLVVFGAGLSVSVQGGKVWTQLFASTGAQSAARRGFRTLAAELSFSSARRVTITTGSGSDVLQFQEPVSLNNDVIVWGAEGSEGRSIRYSVVGNRLVRQVMSANDQPVGRARWIAEPVDDMAEGEKGFQVSRSGGVCTVRLRVRATKEGRVWYKQYETGVCLRNP